MTTTPSAPGEGATLTLTLNHEQADMLEDLLIDGMNTAQHDLDGWRLHLNREDRIEAYEALVAFAKEIHRQVAAFLYPATIRAARLNAALAAAAPRPAEEADGRHQPTEEAIESALDFGRRQLAFAAKERERRQKQTRSSRRVNGHAI